MLLKLCGHSAASAPVLTTPSSRPWSLLSLGFHDGGFEFDTGLHYVGRVEKYKALFDLVTGKGCKPIEWAQMGTKADGLCYDEIQLGGSKPFKFCAGEAAFVENLIKEFPKERAAVEEYVRLCKRVNKIADMYFYCKVRVTGTSLTRH